MAVSVSSLQAVRHVHVPAMRAPALPDPLGQRLQTWRRQVPDLQRLTLRLRLPHGGDAAMARRTVLDQIEAAPRPAGLSDRRLAFDVAATGSAPLFGEALAATAAAEQCAVVLDLPDASSGRDDLDAMDALRRLADAARHSQRLTVTLGTRWQRSLDDAQWAAESHLPVRLVPGHTADPRQPQLAPAAGLLAMARRFAGRWPHVTLAWPDASTALEALRWLMRAGTPCELEISAQRPSGALCQTARRLGVPLRLTCDWTPPVSAGR